MVTSPDKPGLSTEARTLPGRWQGEKTQGGDDYLLVSETDRAGRYQADIYEAGVIDTSHLFSLYADRDKGKYWGLATGDNDLQGELLFHLTLSGDRAEFRWPVGDKTVALLEGAGLAYEKDHSSGFIKWLTIRIRAPRGKLLKALQTGGEQILDSDITLFRRIPPPAVPAPN